MLMVLSHNKLTLTGSLFDAILKRYVNKKITDSKSYNINLKLNMYLVITFPFTRKLDPVILNNSFVLFQRGNRSQRKYNSGRNTTRLRRKNHSYHQLNALIKSHQSADLIIIAA